MKLAIITTLFVVLSVSLTSCAGGGAADTAQAGEGHGVLSRMRPKASADSIEELKAAEARAREEQIRLAQQAANNQGANMNGVGRVLPPVSTDPIAPSAESIASGPVVNNYNPASSSGPPLLSDNKSDPSKIDSASLTPARDIATPIGAPPVADAATYGSSYSSGYMPTSVPGPPPGAIAGGAMVPPPPAVTLSTNANIAYGGENPYLQAPPPPYAMPTYQQYPYPYYQMPPPGMQQPPPQQEPQRPAGLFGSGKKKQAAEESDEDEESARAEKKQADFVPIRPVGMEARSPYKQKDDLKILWNGAASAYTLSKLSEKDGEVAMLLKKIDVGLPPDASKGMFTVAPRRVSSIFRPIASEKKSIETVRKVQFDLVQAYYRYLYAYNKFALQQQTVAARKQEIEVASSNAERQRAEADLVRAQDAAQSATEDMRAAQEELAAVAGAQSARTIIGRVSGITPSTQTLAQAEKSAEPIEIDSKDSGSLGGVFGSVGNFFFRGGGGDKKAKAPVPDDAIRVDSAPVKTAKEKGPKVKAPKDNKKGGKNADGDEDLMPSRKVAHTPKSDPGMPPVTQRSQPSSPISFELTNVEITARKSILTVSIHNGGSDTLKLTPDVVSIAEGDKKISEAAMRAEFESNSVKPNGEVTGKITIFGRPWNDRLAVYISDGANNIQLKRNRN